VKRKTKTKAAKTSAAQLQSSTARLKLAARTRPYFVKVARGAWVGYRKPLAGPGSWAVRVGVAGGKGWEKTLWGADDNGVKPDGDKVLTFWQAKSEAQKLAGRKLDASIMTATDDGAPITLDAALTQYGAALLERGALVYNEQRARYHLPEALLSKPLSLITEDELKSWRGELLKKGQAKSSVNRIMNATRAALSLADETRTHIWRGGLKALSDATKANNVVIEDEATAQAWVAASYGHDHQLGLLTHTLGETGARPSQAARLRVRDLIVTDPKTPRLMMPRSGKGGTRSPEERKAEQYPVSISPELAALLKISAKGRPSNATLLLRQNGQPWKASDASSDYRRDVRRVLKGIGLDPDVYTLYAFRHTSITRQLLAGTHTAIVAKTHDTSEAMIRKHYAASILDYTDEITRKTLPSLGPAQRAASNVVALAKR
jgi:integrase